MRNKIAVLILFFADIFGIFISLTLSVVFRNFIKDEAIFLDIFRYVNFIPTYIFMIFLLLYQGIYIRRYDFWHESQVLLKSSFFGLCLTLSILTLMKTNYEYSKLVFILFAFFVTVVLSVFKFVLKNLLFKLGFWQRRAKILGEGSEFEEYILSNHYLGYIPAKGRNYESLFISSGKMKVENLNGIIEQNIRQNKEILFTPVLTGYDFSKAYIYNIFNSRTNLVAIQNSLKSRLNLLLKRALDLILIVLAMPFLLIVFGILYFLIKLKEPSQKVFFSQKRMGINGKLFDCLKFRSMRENGDKILKEYLDKNPHEIEYFQKFHKYKNDPRITKIGKFIRKTSLDELPQIINVIKGDMSLVGPRPYLECEKEAIGKSLDLILSVRPGITGIWQVSGRSDIDFETRAKLDIWYIKNWNIYNDIVIILKTLKVVLLRKGAM